MTDDEILSSIRLNGFRQCEKAMEYLYKSFYQMVESHIIKNNGLKEDAKDIFQETLMVLYKKAKSDDFVLTSKISTFIFSIAKNLWLKELGQKKKLKIIDEENFKDEGEIENIETHLIYTEEQILIGKLLNDSTDICKKILQYVFYDKLKMEKIAKLLGLASAQESRNRKLKCMKKIRAVVLGNDFYKKTLENLG